MPHRLVSRLNLLFAIAIAVAGCGNEAPASSLRTDANLPTLEGTSWVVVAVNGVTPIQGTRPALSFGGGGKVKGSGGCNAMGGAYQFDPSTGRLALNELGATAMGCLQPGVNEFETRFIQALGSASQASLDGSGRLLIATPAGLIILAPERPAA